MIRSTRVSTLAIVFLAAAVMCAAMAAESYRVYANARFGTTADLPAEWKSDPPPDNGDGLRFRSPDGRGSITVAGNLQVWSSIDEGMSMFEPSDKDAKVTYRHRDGRTLVLSGTRGDMIFYEKHILSCGDQIWNNLYVEYPASQKAAYDALVTRVSRSLRAGRSGQVPKC